MVVVMKRAWDNGYGVPLYCHERPYFFVSFFFTLFSFSGSVYCTVLFRAYNCNTLFHSSIYLSVTFVFSVDVVVICTITSVMTLIFEQVLGVLQYVLFLLYAYHSECFSLE